MVNVRLELHNQLKYHRYFLGVMQAYSNIFVYYKVLIKGLKNTNGIASRGDAVEGSGDAVPADRAAPRHFVRHHGGWVDNSFACGPVTGPVRVRSMLVAPERPHLARLTPRDPGIVVVFRADGCERLLGSILVDALLGLVADRVYDVLRQVNR